MSVSSKSWTKKGLLGLLVLLLISPAALVGYASHQALYPSWYEPSTPQKGLSSFEGTRVGDKVLAGIYHDPRTDLGLNYEEVSFGTHGGATLRAWYVPGAVDADVGVVAVHGAGMDRRQFLRHVPIFHDLGYPVLLFDCREHGISDGQARGIGLAGREHEDAIAAGRYIRTRGAKKVVMIGTSQGGSSAILAAAQDPGIDVIISENPFASFRMLVEAGSSKYGPLGTLMVNPVYSLLRWRTDTQTLPEPLDVVAMLSPRPLLLMHGTDDQFVPYQHSELLFARAGQPKALWKAEGSRHVVLFNTYPEEYRAQVSGFLQDYAPLRRTGAAEGAAADSSAATPDQTGAADPGASTAHPAPAPGESAATREPVPQNAPAAAAAP